MGKKRKCLKYDKRALQNLADALKNSRREIKTGAITKLFVETQKLERVIKTLPKKEREAIEKYWGLNPGTPILANQKVPLATLLKDVAKQRLKKQGMEGMYKLVNLQFASQYDPNVEELIKHIVSKCDTKETNMSEMDVVRHVLIFLIFFEGGPHMIYEDEGECLTEKEEQMGEFDMYTLLDIAWKNVMSTMPDNSINLKLLMETINMMDCSDVNLMREYVGFSIEKEQEGSENNKLVSFADIRKFKERIFEYGAWEVTNALIFTQGVRKTNMAPFAQKMPALKKSQWKKLADCQRGNKEIPLSKGVIEVPVYKIGGLTFTDPYEIQSLSVATHVSD